MHAHEFLRALATVLCVAAVTTVVFQRLRQPVVLGYMLAGLIVGPHVPIPLVADLEIVSTLAELGVILLMFSLGLEFSLGTLFRVGPSAGLTAIIQASILMSLGFAVGRAFGWTLLESTFTGALIAISSTTIIAKAFDEEKVGGRLRELVVGILIVEDLIAILLMATLTALAAGGGFSAGELAASSGRLALFLIGLLGVGILLVPRAMIAIVRLDRPETTLVAAIGLCFALSLLALELGYSVALGAFLAGSLIAESGAGTQVEHLVKPVRDMFAAIFFVSVGMLIDPAVVVRHGAAVVALVLAVVGGNIASVTLGAFLTGNGVRTSVQAGMSLAQIGEFSFIIAGLGISLGATGEFLYPVAVAVSAITTLMTPWLIRASAPAASFVDRKLPHRLQTFAALYGSWLERLRTAPASRTRGGTIRRLAALLLVDAALLGGLLIAASISAPRITAFVESRLGVTPAVSFWLIVAGVLAASAPLAFGIFRLSHRLGATLAQSVLPETEVGRLDLAAAPRRALVVTLQLGIVLLVAIPLLAVTQPFLPRLPSALAFAAAVALLAIVFWRSAANLEGHVRAGAQIIAEALTAQGTRSAPAGELSFASVQALLPGLGEPTLVRLAPASVCVGKSLSDLNLRGITGATVLAIARGGAGIVVPTADQVLNAGDVIALAGTNEARDAAAKLLS